MDTLRDRLWIWGHLAGSHDQCIKPDRSAMSPLEGALYLGANNVFMISYAGSPTPPFDKYNRALGSLRQVKWSIVGDSSSPENAGSLGATEEVIRQSKRFPNITGGMFDDFFNEKRLNLYPPSLLHTVRRRLHENNLDMWGVLYDHQLHDPIEEHLELFDGISFWTWDEQKLDRFEENYASFLEITRGKRRMLGCYPFNYSNNTQATVEKMDYQLNRYTRAMRDGEAEGIIFCSNTVCDQGYEAVEYAREWIKKNSGMTF